MENVFLPEGLENKTDMDKELAVTRFITSLLEGYGCVKVEPSLLDYLENVDVKGDMYSSNALFKSIDNDGKVLALNNDITPSLVKSVASKCDKQAVRVYYREKLYSFKPFADGKRYCTALGMDIFASSGAETDYEVLCVAKEVLKKLNCQDYRIVVSHAGLLRNIAEFYRVHDVTNRDLTVLTQGGRLLNVPQECADKIYEISRFNGGIEAIQAASDKLNTKAAVDCLLNLYEVYQLMAQGNDEVGMTFDFGYVSESRYYNGIIFKVIDAESGDTLMTGGRYAVSNGAKWVADCSLKFNVTPLVNMAQRHNVKLFGRIDKDVVIGCADSINAVTKAVHMRAKLAESDLKVDILYRTTQSETLAYADAHNIGQRLFVDADGKINN